MLLALFLIGEVAQLGMWYRLSVLLSALLMLYQYALIRDRQPANCFRAFVHNQHIGSVIFIGIALAYIFEPAT